MEKKKIIFTGGGTAGHVYPALAIAENLKNYEIHYIGGKGIEKEIVGNEKYITYHEISPVKLERKFTLKNLLIPIKLLKSIIESKKIIKKISPSVIFSKGGFVAVPVAIAGKSLKVPIISHESDLSFGLANKIILKVCSTMCTTFPTTGAKISKCIYTGQPIRNKILNGQRLKTGFNNSKKTILVLGGSLGAKFINEIIIKNLDDLTQYYNIIHITGKNNFKDIKHQGYYSVPYAKNIEDFYKSSDIAIARAGSGVINELLNLKIPMLLIPLSKKCSRGDQIENAKLFNELGFCEILEEENYSYNNLINKLNYLIKNRNKIINNMKNNKNSNAVNTIIKLIKNY